MVTETGQLVWAAEHDTWGTVRKIRAGFTADEPEIKVVGISDFNENTALKLQPDLEIYECPIRFQGQWEDAETGLYYNRFRYYQTLTTQYNSTDPMRLLGGFNLHSYVNIATIQIDPFGLRPCCYADNPQALYAASRDRCGVTLDATKMRELALTMSRIQRGDTSNFARDGDVYLNDTSIEAMPGVPTAALQPGL